ncbi:hypothetical protein MVES_000137 [Malassezia vespertilionis]|uniref:Pet117p n=1 Tax=Malassezia vespertilionis TaxID=2020962 RepID=A0A2N1JFL5_9BASI|nr:hypothetical protein MVES_000137 [Malassezia vespertilionis]
MSRASKFALVSSIVTTTTIVWGVHYLQRQERENMYKGVQRDDARQVERKQRMADLERNRQREQNLLEIQPIEMV